MDKSIHRVVQSHGSAITESFGEQLGSRLRGGEIIELSSDLGGGKTTLVRGIVRGAGSQDHVASPTFTLSKEYHTASIHIHHFDFYRLPEAGIMTQELAELLEDHSNVVIIEWSDIVQHVLPDGHIKITLKRIKSGEDNRELILEASEKFQYLFEDIL